MMYAWIVYVVYQLTMGWMIQRSNLSVSEIVSTHLDQPWDPTSLLYNGYCVSFPGVK